MKIRIFPGLSCKCPNLSVIAGGAHEISPLEVLRSAFWTIISQLLGPMGESKVGADIYGAPAATERHGGGPLA